MHFRGLSPNMDINLDLTSFSRAMDCDLRQQGGDKKHKNREDFSQNVGLHTILLLYSHWRGCILITFIAQFQVPEKRAKFERTADMLAKSGLLDITMKTAELLRSNQQVTQLLYSILEPPHTCDVRHGKIWSSLRLRLMNSWSLFWRILETR